MSVRRRRNHKTGSIGDPKGVGLVGLAVVAPGAGGQTHGSERQNARQTRSFRDHRALREAVNREIETAHDSQRSDETRETQISDLFDREGETPLDCPPAASSFAKLPDLIRLLRTEPL